jgi:hypothetical protein
VSGCAPEHRRRAERAAFAALDRLGLRARGGLEPLATPPSRWRRQVLRVRVGASRLGVSQVVARVLLDPTPQELAGFAREQHTVWVLHQAARAMEEAGRIGWTPVQPAIHARPVRLPGAAVAVYGHVPAWPGPVDAERFGAMLATLHEVTSSARAAEVMRAWPRVGLFAGLRAGDVAAAFARAGHPLAGRVDVAGAFVAAVRERVVRALELDPRPVLAHRDLHVLNCVNTEDGPVSVDWQEAGWGSRSDDFAWLYLQVRRFGGDPVLLEQALDGYRRAAGDHWCPSLEQVSAAAAVRELVFLGFSLAKADLDEEHRVEALRELPALTDPRVPGQPWRLLFNPAVFDPGFLPAPREWAVAS